MSNDTIKQYQDQFLQTIRQQSTHTQNQITERIKEILRLSPKSRDEGFVISQNDLDALFANQAK